jgi:hypothetical protein
MMTIYNIKYAFALQMECICIAKHYYKRKENKKKDIIIYFFTTFKRYIRELQIKNSCFIWERLKSMYLNFTVSRLFIP